MTGLRPSVSSEDRTAGPKGAFQPARVWVLRDFSSHRRDFVRREEQARFKVAGASAIWLSPCASIGTISKPARRNSPGSGRTPNMSAARRRLFITSSSSCSASPCGASRVLSTASICQTRSRVFSIFFGKASSSSSRNRPDEATSQRAGRRSIIFRPQGARAASLHSLVGFSKFRALRSRHRAGPAGVLPAP
jgi:hypothetical protein